MSARRLSTLILMLAVALAACAGGGDPSAVGPSPSVTAPASQEPTPSPTPIDVADGFATRLASLTELASTISGTVTIGEVDGEIAGHVRVKDNDRHNLTVITYPGQPAMETETILVDGVSYQRTPAGIWMQSEGGGAGAAADPVSAALSRAGDLEVVGTEEVEGDTVHRLESDGPLDVGPAALGLTDPSVMGFEADVAFLAEDDGTPAGIIITAAWTQGPEEAPVPAEFEMRVLFTVGAAVTIKAPPDPYSRYTSAELGYGIAHPVDWDVTHQPATDVFPAGDLFVGPVDGEVQVYRYDDIPADLVANIWFRGTTQNLAENFGVEPELVEEMTLPNGLEVQVLNLEVNQEGVLYFYQQAVVFGGNVAWDLDWYSLPGYEADARARFLNFVTSFEPAP